MKINIDQSDLFKAVQIVQRSISIRSTLPILGGILFEADGSKIRLTATDLEIALSTEIDADVKKTGKVVIPGKLLGDIVRNLPEAELTISVDGADNVRIESEHSNIEVKALNLEDFPQLPHKEIGKSFVLKRTSILEGIKQVVKAASSDESRPVLTGVLLTIDGKKLRLVATDSYRLALRDEDLAKKIEDVNVIVPSRAIGELARIIPLGKDEMTVRLSENQVVFDLGETVLVSRLIEGDYPNYEQLLPDKHEIVLEASKDSLMQAVRRAALLAQNTPLKLSLIKDELRISAETSGIGQAEEVVDVKKKGDDLEIAFNPQYLIDGIAEIKGDKVFFEFVNPLKPGFLKGTEDNFRALIMPVRT